VRAAIIHLILFAALGWGSAAAADQVDELSLTATAGGSEKARIAAVVALGRLADPRGFPALARALEDPSPVVRGVAASALGHLGLAGKDPRALPALEAALDDENAAVRDRALDAVVKLRGSAPSRTSVATVPTRARIVPREAPRRAAVQVAVNRMGGTGRHLSGRMHELVVRQLAEAPGVAISDGVAELVVDGSITRLSRETRGRYVEVTCEVRLTVSSSSGSLLSIVSGGATVQASRGQQESRLQAEALDNAVRGIHPKLVAFLSRHTR
jgi:hypothetical protein